MLLRSSKADSHINLPVNHGINKGDDVQQLDDWMMELPGSPMNRERTHRFTLISVYDAMK